MLFLLFIFISSSFSQTIKQLPEISILEELPIGSTVTSLTDKIPNLDQSIEYDLVSPLSSDLDLFSIDHQNHLLKIKNRIDYEYLCTKKSHCTISVSIARSNEDTIDVYILPIRIRNINDNSIRFVVNRTVIEIEENDDHWQEKSYPLPRAFDDDGDRITYSLYLHNWSKPSSLFEFDEENFRLKPLKKFDREEQNIYLLRLVAHNQNDISTDIIVVIKDLNDNSPKCEHNFSIFFISNFSKISIFHLNVTDLDEGENGKLEYRFSHSYPGFTLDRFNGQIKFHFQQWKRTNQSILIVNITDHGQLNRLSTQCYIQIQMNSLYDIDFHSNISLKNPNDIILEIENLHSSIGYLNIFDRQINRTCFDCLIHVNSSIENLFYFNSKTFEFYLNFNSLILKRILTNYFISKEYLLLKLTIQIQNQGNKMIQTEKIFVMRLYFNKIHLLIHSNIYFFKINKNLGLNEKISIRNPHHSCLNNETNELNLIDSTNTFEFDGNLNLILKKYLNIKQRNHYQLILQDKSTNRTDSRTNLFCSIQLHIYIFDLYSNDLISPYFSQPFYILSSLNLSNFYLPAIPSHVKYISSVPDLITINPYNASIILRSSLLYSAYYYDFSIEARDSQIPSLSSSISIRIFFGQNKYSPRLLMNSTQQIQEIFSSNFLYQIQAYDPDILLNNQINLYPPAIEYELEDKNNSDIEIERYTGRIFLKNFNRSKINFTLIIKDFGQTNRLIHRENFHFDFKSKQTSFSFSLIFMILFILIFLLLLIILLLFIHCCCSSSTRKKTLKSHEKSTWKNVSPTTPDTHLIDHEYITTLPRISPPYLNKSHLSLDQYHSETISIKDDYQKHFSITDVNRYLERFEKIYNDSSSQQYLHQPIGSVV